MLEARYLESISLHSENLPSFDSAPDWQNIEWFMGSVILANAGVALNQDSNEVELLLCSGLRRRLDMMNTTAGPSSTELANLRWWTDVAMRVPAPAREFAVAVNELDRCLATGAFPYLAIGAVLRVADPLAS